jgi:hypothetical protein
VRGEREEFIGGVGNRHGKLENERVPREKQGLSYA